MIDQRPIIDANDFQEKIKSTPGLSKRFITSYVEVLDGYTAVDRIIEEIERLGGDLSSILDVWKSLQDSDDTLASELRPIGFNTNLYKDAMDGYLHIQPSTIKAIDLKSYQLLGINWLLMLYRKNISCILADEMGLGKTAQVIGFLARLKEIGEKGPHLIVVPASTLANWMREIERFCPELNVLCYYDKAEVRRELQDLILYNPNHGYNIVLTSYTIATQSKEDRSALKKMKFKSLILDEGHMIKNCTSARYSALMSYKIPFRLLVTGTPLQNNLQELVSLLIFIMPTMFTDFEDEVRTIFKIKSMTTTEDAEKEQEESNQSRTNQSSVQILSQKRIARAKKMMTPFVLRRKKEDVLKDLPKKTRIVEKCAMTERQKEVYDTIVQKTTKAYASSKHIILSEIKHDSDDEVPAAGENDDNFSNISNMIIHLRKAADHPLLFRFIYNDKKIRKMAKAIMREEKYWDADEDYIYEDMSYMNDFELSKLCEGHRTISSFKLKDEEWMDSGKVEKLKVLLPEMKRKKQKVLIFSQFTRMLDILELVMNTLEIRYLRMDGSTKVTDRQTTIDTFNESDELDVFLLSTKAGGFGINLTGANIVILYDHDFNPQTDRQAEDRAHRVGQTKDVTIYKLMSENTIEEYILEMAELKLRLDDTISSEAIQDDSRTTTMQSLLKRTLLASTT
ncbi:SNF2 family N-terminal domain-containing protein [Phycomyces nitens]|nr:SNF2 family N-terminal domain-containing protein [Phycomyces nitens]